MSINSWFCSCLVKTTISIVGAVVAVLSYMLLIWSEKIARLCKVNDIAGDWRGALPYRWSALPSRYHWWEGSALPITCVMNTTIQLSKRVTNQWNCPPFPPCTNDCGAMSTGIFGVRKQVSKFPKNNFKIISKEVSEFFIIPKQVYWRLGSTWT